MENSICLDTNILVDLLRNKSDAVKWVEENESNNILATTIINVFELYSGAYKAHDSENKILAVKKLVGKLKILYFNDNGAEEAGRLNAQLESKGASLEKRDLFIGAIALLEGFALKTDNKKHFLRIVGLKVI